MRGPTGGFDLRTRVDGESGGVDPVVFLDRELPELLDSASELLRTADHLDLRPLVVAVGDDSWLLERRDGSVGVRRAAPGAAATWHTDAETLSDVVDDVITPIGLFTSGELRLEGTGIGTLLDWWLVLRCTLDGRPVHEPGSIDLRADLGRSFTLDDEPEEIVGFLSETGFLHLREVFSQAEMEAISADMDRLAPTYSPGDGNSWWATLADGSEQVVRMQRFDERSAATAELLDDGRLRRISELPGCGYDTHWSDGDNRIEALFKPIGVERGISDVPWHKDCSLGRHSYRCCSLTVGVSVTGAGPGSGQLRVVAGSHRALVWPSLLDPATTGLPVVPLPTRTGDVTVHLSCTLHMAEPPTTAPRRVLYTGFGLPPPDPAAARAAAERVRRARESAPVITSQLPTRPEPEAVGRRPT